MSDKFAAAFNLWMDDYTKNPESFTRQENDALAFLREKLDGKEPSYGESCAHTFQRYLDAAE